MHTAAGGAFLKRRRRWKGLTRALYTVGGAATDIFVWRCYVVVAAVVTLAASFSKEPLIEECS